MKANELVKTKVLIAIISCWALSGCGNDSWIGCGVISKQEYTPPGVYSQNICTNLGKTTICNPASVPYPAHYYVYIRDNNYKDNRVGVTENEYAEWTVGRSVCWNGKYLTKQEE